MAARVNVKFVIALAALVAALFIGTAGVFAFVKLRSGDRYLRLGDEAMAAKDYETADKFYARAVAKDPGNPEWLMRWRGARENVTPEIPSTYQQDYAMYVHGILLSLATSQRTNVEAHREYLDAIYQEVAQRQNWPALIEQTEMSLGYFDAEQPPPALRRYRGLAVAAIVDMEAEITDEDREQGREDLEAALAEDPKDVIAARALAVWHRKIALSLDTKRKAEAEAREEHLKKSRAVLAEFLRVSPDHPLAVVDQLAMRASDVDLLGDPEARTSEAVKMIVGKKLKALEDLKPDLATVEQHLLSRDSAEIDRVVVESFFQIAPRIDPQEGPARMLSVVDHALKSNPNAAHLLWQRAAALIQANRTEEAIEQFAAIAELPNLPVSIEGVQLWETRRQARFVRTNIAIAAAMQATDAKERETALERAREYRRELSRHIAEGTPDMQFIDGKLLYAEGDFLGAQRSLTEFIRSTGGVRDSISMDAARMLADCALRLGSPGLAREYLHQLRATGSLEVLMSLAGVEVSLQNYTQAEQLYRQVLDRDSDNEVAKSQLQILLAMRQEGTVEDPVTQLLVEVEAIARGSDRQMGDEQAAIRHLEQGLRKHDYDQRLVIKLAQIKQMAGDTPGTLAVLEDAERRHPENPTFAQIRQGLMAADSLDMTLSLIDEAEIPEFEKWISKYRAYTRHGKTAEAAAALESAARLNADHLTVVELKFDAAINRNDLAEAGKLADQAARLDLDRADGDIFRARLQLAQNNARQAVITLQRAAERGNVGAPGLRLLGRVQAQTGRTIDAIATLRRALELSPADGETIILLIGVLAQANMPQEALTVARASEVHLRRDPQFVNIWLSLEAQTGNNRFALERREQILARDASNHENAAALAELYITERQFDKARQLIDTLRANNTIRIVALDARWHADRGDLQRAYQVFVEHIESLARSGQPVGMEPYLALGDFMIQRGQLQAGVAALYEAIPFQDPKTRSVEILIANLLLQFGQPDQAEKMLRGVLAAGVEDPQQMVRTQLVESLLLQLRYEDAQRELGEAAPGAEEGVQTLAQRSDAARGLGDMRRAREFLDRAVARFPEEPMGYIRRARLLMAEPQYAPDALADLATALRLRPGLTQAHLMRAIIHFNAQNPGEALREIIAGVNADPHNIQFRLGAMKRLLEHGRESEAVDLASAGSALRPADGQMHLRLGDVFERESRWTPAARFYRQAWEIAGDETSALRYVNALVKAAPANQTSAPQYTEAIRVLSTPSLKIDTSIGLLMSRAGLLRRQGRNDVARADTLQAHSLIGDDPRLLEVWSDRAREVYPDSREMLAILGATRPSAAVEPWHGFIRGRVLSADPATRSEGISIMQSVGEQTSSTVLRLNALKALSLLLAEDQDWEGAFEATRKGLAITTEDAMLNNNAAFFLVEKLDRPADGLPYAEKAASIEPSSRTILDTLASAQWGAGDKAKAISTLSVALQGTRDESPRASLAMKLGRWKLESGDQGGARGMASIARDAISDMTNPNEELQTELTTLLEEIERTR